MSLLYGIPYLGDPGPRARLYKLTSTATSKDDCGSSLSTSQLRNTLRALVKSSENSMVEVADSRSEIPVAWPGIHPHELTPAQQVGLPLVALGSARVSGRCSSLSATTTASYTIKPAQPRLSPEASRGQRSRSPSSATASSRVHPAYRTLHQPCSTNTRQGLCKGRRLLQIQEHPSDESTYTVAQPLGPPCLSSTTSKRLSRLDEAAARLRIKRQEARETKSLKSTSGATTPQVAGRGIPPPSIVGKSCINSENCPAESLVSIETKVCSHTVYESRRDAVCVFRTHKSLSHYPHTHNGYPNRGPGLDHFFEAPLTANDTLPLKDYHNIGMSLIPSTQESANILQKKNSLLSLSFPSVPSMSLLDECCSSHYGFCMDQTAPGENIRGDVGDVASRSNRAFPRDSTPVVCPIWAQYHSIDLKKLHKNTNSRSASADSGVWFCQD